MSLTLSQELAEKYHELTVSETRGRHFQTRFNCGRTDEGCIEARGGANGGKDGITTLIPGGRGCIACGVTRRRPTPLLGGEL